MCAPPRTPFLDTHVAQPTPAHLAVVVAHGDDLQRVLRGQQRLLADALSYHAAAAPRVLAQLQVGAGGVQQVVQHLVL